VKISPYSIARAVAGHEALRVVESHGVAAGQEILEGYAVAFARSLCALKGVNEARLFLDKHMPRPDPRKLKVLGQ
jgi:hypothetical protein